MKIYDCFHFFNELDLLEIRLELLYNHVDHFVISEATQTHSGQPKKMFFSENKHLFEKYADKIIHVVNDFPTDMEKMIFIKLENPQTPYEKQYNRIGEIFDGDEEGQLKSYPTFARDYLQREFSKLGLVNCQDEDIILISDLDEIPHSTVVDRIRSEQLVNYTVMMDCHNYYINNIAHTNWYGTYSVRYSETKNVALTHLRNKRYVFDKIFNGGWHLSFCGGPERVKAKIEAYSHQEYNNDNVKGQIQNKMDANSDVFGRGGYSDPLQEFYFNAMRHLDIDTAGYYPKNIVDLVKNKFDYLIKK